MSTEKDQAESLRRKGELLHLMGYPKEAKIYEEAVEKGIMPIVIPISQEEYEKSGGMRAGLIKAEMGLPELYGKGIRFPYIVTEEDWPEEKRDGALFAGMRKFSLDPKLNAVGVELTTNKEGQPVFDEQQCVGKPFLVLYQMVKDSRTPEEGGTGKSYPKAVEAYPPDTTNESLGI